MTEPTPTLAARAKEIQDEIGWTDAHDAQEMGSAVLHLARHVVTLARTVDQLVLGQQVDDGDAIALELAEIHRIVNEIRPLMELRGADAYDAPSKINALIHELLARVEPA